jgi:hypothetical protein
MDLTPVDIVRMQGRDGLGGIHCIIPQGQPSVFLMQEDSEGPDDSIVSDRWWKDPFQVE